MGGRAVKCGLLWGWWDFGCLGLGLVWVAFPFVVIRLIASLWRGVMCFVICCFKICREAQGLGCLLCRPCRLGLWFRGYLWVWFCLRFD